MDQKHSSHTHTHTTTLQVQPSAVWAALDNQGFTLFAVLLLLFYYLFFSEQV